MLTDAELQALAEEKLRRLRAAQAEGSRSFEAWMKTDPLRGMDESDEIARAAWDARGSSAPLTDEMIEAEAIRRYPTDPECAHGNAYECRDRGCFVVADYRGAFADHAKWARSVLRGGER